MAPVLSINAEVAPSVVAISLGHIESWNRVRRMGFEWMLRFQRKVKMHDDSSILGLIDVHNNHARLPPQKASNDAASVEQTASMNLEIPRILWLMKKRLRPPHKPSRRYKSFSSPRWEIALYSRNHPSPSCLQTPLHHGFRRGSPSYHPNHSPHHSTPLWRCYPCHFLVFPCCPFRPQVAHRHMGSRR